MRFETGLMGSRRWLLIWSAVLWVLIFAVRLAVGSSTGEGIVFLFAIPTAMVASEFGLRGGIAAALASCWLIVAWVMLQSVDLELLQYATRVGTLLAVGALVGEFSTLRDRERERLIQRFDNMAHTDELTGLLNRRGWERALERDLARAGRDRSAPSVILIDLDRFKEYNDEGGHPHGDRFLGDAARAWGAVLRRGDVLARVGGDEFAAILAPIAEEARAEEISERLLRATPHGQSCSIGLARWNGRETPGQLLRRADLALYRAKRMGRGRVVSAETPTQPVSARRSASNPG